MKKICCTKYYILYEFCFYTLYNALNKILTIEIACTEKKILTEANQYDIINLTYMFEKSLFAVLYAGMTLKKGANLFKNLGLLKGVVCPFRVVSHKEFLI